MTSQINLRTPSKKSLEEIPILIGASVASKSAVATCPRCTHSNLSQDSCGWSLSTHKIGGRLATGSNS